MIYTLDLSIPCSYSLPLPNLPCISGRKETVESAMIFFSPTSNWSEILLSLPLTHVQILTTSCCHFCYPSHATKISCWAIVVDLLLLLVFSYVQFPSWKLKSPIESFPDFHIKSSYPHSAYLLHFLFHFLHSTCTDHFQTIM